MSSLINPLITDAGIAAAIAANGLGLQLAITHIALGSGQYTPSAGLTNMVTRKEKVAIPSGYVTGTGGFRINALFPSWAGTPNPYNATEIGFWAGDPDAGGILFAVHSHTSAVIVQRNALDYVVQFSMQLTRVPAGSVTVTVDPGASQMLALMAAHEAAADPHTVYAKKASIQGAAYSSAVAAGAADALTGAFTPAITALPAAPGTLSVLVRATGANVTTTPTFAANGTAAKTIVKGNGLALSAGDISGAGHWLDLQYDATLDKWVLLNPAFGAGVTPAQFDNTTKATTTAFGKIRGIEASGVTVLTATGNITNSHMGGTVIMNNGSTATMTLPAANSVPPGVRVEFLAIGTALATIQRAGADTIVVNNSSITALTMGSGDSLTLESNGSGQWYAIAGTAQLSRAAVFASSLIGGGYQKLPSGLILQWGAASVTANVGLPISWSIVFPSALLIVLVTFGGGAIAKTGYNSGTTSGVTIFADAGGPINWLSIGI